MGVTSSNQRHLQLSTIKDLYGKGLKKGVCVTYKVLLVCTVLA